MMRRPLSDLGADKTGGTLVEFALLAPLIFGLMFGIFAIGMQMWNYNSVRSVSADVSRHAVIEYQKSNLLTAEQIEEIAAATAMQPQHGLSGTQLDVDVTEETSPIAGAKKFNLSWTYQTAVPVKLFGLSAPQLVYDQDIYVRAPASD